MFVLDTNVVSELRKSGDGRADANVLRWIAQADASSFYLSVITIFEIEHGIVQLERRNPGQGANLRSWMDHRVRQEFADRILPVDDAVATRCALLPISDERNMADALIAATAIVHRMTVVTRNVRDFDAMGVEVINPWTA